MAMLFPKLRRVFLDGRPVHDALSVTTTIRVGDVPKVCFDVLGTAREDAEGNLYIETFSFQKNKTEPES